jgi:hypothetical protein
VLLARVATTRWEGVGAREKQRRGGAEGRGDGGYASCPGQASGSLLGCVLVSFVFLSLISGLVTRHSPLIRCVCIRSWCGRAGVA